MYSIHTVKDTFLDHEVTNATDETVIILELPEN
jgi:hypothetical protein